MEKDFWRWHGKKEQVNKLIKLPFFHEREVWFCYVGANVGFEQDGKGEDFLRPIVIIRKFNNDIFWGIPLTRVKKKIKPKAEKYYFVFSFIGGVKSAAVLSQIKLMDARRLSRHIGVISKTDFKLLTKKLKALLP